MPDRDLPKDFEEKHDSAWVWIPNHLFDLKKGHASMGELSWRTPLRRSRCWAARFTSAGEEAGGRSSTSTAPAGRRSGCPTSRDSRNDTSCTRRPIPAFSIFALDIRFPERLQQLLFYDVNNPFARAMRVPDGAELPEEMVTNFLNAMAATAKVGWNPLLHDPRLEKLLHQVKAETLCLWGEHDRVVPPVYGEKYAKLIPGASLRILPECGHRLPFEKPSEFVVAVSEFVG